jgi:hypothetical protein
MYSFRTHELHHGMKAQLLQQMRASCRDLMIGCELSASEAYVAKIENENSAAPQAVST